MNEQQTKKLGYTADETITQEMDKVIRSIVDSRTADVASVVRSIRGMLKDDTDELTDLEINDILLQLPVLLFDAMEEQELLGMHSDMANQLYKQAQSEAYRLAHGTVADKTAIADLQTRQEQFEKIIFDRSYKIIKQQFDMAIETLNAVKKVQASRQQKLDLGRFGPKF